MKYIRIFFLIYVVVIGLLYAFFGRSEIPKLVPGDIFIRKAGRNIYIPLGASLIITGLIFALVFRWIK